MKDILFVLIRLSDYINTTIYIMVISKSHSTFDHSNIEINSRNINVF